MSGAVTITDGVVSGFSIDASGNKTFIVTHGTDPVTVTSIPEGDMGHSDRVEWMVKAFEHDYKVDINIDAQGAVTSFTVKK